MARQIRSAATRRKLLDAAVDVFGEVGCVAAGRVAIVQRAGVTKGALYHHFDSMEALVSAVVEDGCGAVLGAFRAMCSPSAPALEGMIHGMFAAAEVIAADRGARVATQLAVALGDRNAAAAGCYTDWLREIAGQIRRAIDEGDLREDLDAEGAGEVIVGAMFGTQLMPCDGAVVRLTRMWELLLPAIVEGAALPYFREFLARETLRHQPAS